MTITDERIAKIEECLRAFKKLPKGKNDDNVDFTWNEILALIDRLREAEEERAKLRSDAIREFCSRVDLLPSIEAKHIPPDVRLYRMEGVVQARRTLKGE